MTDNKGNSLTGHWRYSELNHFIMGYGKAYNNKYGNLLEALKEIADKTENVIPEIYLISINAIKKCEQ